MSSYFRMYRGSPVFYVLSVAFVFLLSMMCGGSSLATPVSKDFGEYTVHVNAFNSDALQPSMAKAYNIVRSKNRGLLTISVVKKSLSENPKPVKAKVSGKATNLTGQLKDIQIREINDGGAVYYISEFHVADKEVLDFTVYLTPDENTSPITVELRQQFFTQ